MSFDVQFNAFEPLKEIARLDADGVWHVNQDELLALIERHRAAEERVKELEAEVEELHRLNYELAESALAADQRSEE